jgi:hypothetical protein
VGTAELHPSKAAPWVGTTIIQVKHTIGYNRSFSESEFFSTTAMNTVLSKEIPRIKKLRDKKQLDHYMLFANRRLTGNADSSARTMRRWRPLTGYQKTMCRQCVVRALPMK